MESVINLEEHLVETFKAACEQRGLVCKIPGGRFLEMREEFKFKLNWGKEVQHCVDWLYDHNIKMITCSRLRNWMNKALRIQKDQELKLMTKGVDKQTANGGFSTNATYTKPFRIPQRPKLEPLWQPPK